MIRDDTFQRSVRLRRRRWRQAIEDDLPAEWGCDHLTVDEVWELTQRAWGRHVVDRLSTVLRDAHSYEELVGRSDWTPWLTMIYRGDEED